MRGAVRLFLETFGADREFGEHPIAVPYPAGAVVGQGGFLQHFETEPGDATGDATGLHGITGRGWHGASDEDRTIGQYRQGFPAGAGNRRHFQHRPVGTDITSVIQSVGKGITRIRRGGNPEVPHEMLTAKRLRQIKDKLGSDGGLNGL